MSAKEKTKKSNRFFSLFRTKKSKDATKELSKSISVEESFTEINDLIPTTRVEFRSTSHEEEISAPLETPVNIANLENTAPALPKTNGVAKKQSVKRENSQKVKVLAVKSGVSRSASRASKRKRKARAAPPPPTTQPQNTVETIEKVDELVPPKPPRDPKFVEEPTPSRKNTSVEEKKEEIRRQLSQDHLSSLGDPDEVMSLKSQSSTSCSSRRIETEVLHYSPAGSLRGGPAPRKEQSMSTENLPVVERRSNIILNDNQRVRSIPISMYDGRPKQRAAPTPPDNRKTVAAPPPPPVMAMPPTMINGFVASSRPMAPAIPTHGLKSNGREDTTKKMTEQDQDLWVRYEELKNKFERWKALQMEDKSSAEAKKLQKELIHDNDRVVEMLRESYPDHVGISTMRGTFITTKKKRQSLNTDMFQPRLPSSPTIRAPLIIAPTYVGSYAGGSQQVPSTSSPTTSRSATPKTTSSASISPSASDDSVDSGMGRNTSNKKVYSIPIQVPMAPTVAPVTIRPQLKKQAASMDENSNNIRMKNGGIRSSQENQKAVDRIHEEARELLRKEKELRGTGPTTPTAATKEITPIEIKIKPKESSTKPAGLTADAHVIKGTVSPQTRHRPPQVAPPPPPVQKILPAASLEANVRSIRTEVVKISSPAPVRPTEYRSIPETQKNSEYRDPKLMREKVPETKVNTIYRNPDSLGAYRVPSINNGAQSPVSSPKTSNVPRLTDNEYAKTPMSNHIKKEAVYSREVINGAPKANVIENGAPKTNGISNGAPKQYGVNGFNNNGATLNNNKPSQPIYAVSKVQPTVNRKPEEREKIIVGGISHTRHSSDTVLSQPKRPTNLTAYPVKDSNARATTSPASSQTIQKIIRDRDSPSARNSAQIETTTVLPSPANIRKVVQDAKVTPPSTPKLPVMGTPFNEIKRDARTTSANVREVIIPPRQEQTRNIQKTVTAASRPTATQSSPLTRPAALDINLALANGIPTLRKVAPPVERHGITTGKVLDTPSTSYDSPSWTPSASTIPPPPPPPPPMMNMSPARPSGGAPIAPPPPPPQLMNSSPLQVSMQQLTAQKDRLKPATPTEKPAGPIDDRDALMAAIRNTGGLNGLRKTART